MSNQIIISGIQQIGVGNPDVHKTWEWYRKNFGMDIKVFEEAADAEFMLPYTGGEPRSRHAVLAVNLQGGGGFEIWQYTGRTPEGPKFDIQLGDLGIYSGKIKSNKIEKAYESMKTSGQKLLGELQTDPRGKKHFFVKDAFDNIFNVVENDVIFKNENKTTGGPFGAIVCCTDIEKSKKFYDDILGYDQVLFEGEGKFDDLAALPGGNGTFKRTILTHSEPRKGGFSELFGSSEIELIQVTDRKARKIFEGRLWGDLGFIHLCFDIFGMQALKEKCEKAGHRFTVDSKADLEGKIFDMGEASGHFSYIEDPDGTLIEFVETYKVPIAKKLNWYIDMKKRNPEKPLPKWMLKAMSLNRVKD